MTRQDRGKSGSYFWGGPDFMKEREQGITGRNFNLLYFINFLPPAFIFISSIFIYFIIFSLSFSKSGPLKKGGPDGYVQGYLNIGSCAQYLRAHTFLPTAAIPPFVYRPHWYDCKVYATKQRTLCFQVVPICFRWKISLLITDFVWTWLFMKSAKTWKWKLADCTVRRTDHFRRCVVHTFGTSFGCSFHCHTRHENIIIILLLVSSWVILFRTYFLALTALFIPMVEKTFRHWSPT